MIKMGYDEFKSELQKAVVRFLKPECTFSINTSFLPNRCFEVLTVKKPNTKDDTGVNVDLEKMFALYQSCGSFGKVLQHIVDIVNFESRLGNYCLEDVLARAREEVFPCLINTDLNKEFLKTVPHREFLDLSVIYKVGLADAGGAVTINSAVLKRMGMTEDELYLAALSNVVGLNGFSVNSLDSKLKCKCNGIDARTVYRSRKELETIELPVVDEIPAYCVEDAHGRNGVSALLIPDLWRGVARSLGESVYILPSSLNELLFMKKSSCRYSSYIVDTIREVNKMEVAVEDFLSDNLYFYNKDTGEISIVA